MTEKPDYFPIFVSVKDMSIWIAPKVHVPISIFISHKIYQSNDGPKIKFMPISFYYRERVRILVDGVFYHVVSVTVWK